MIFSKNSLHVVDVTRNDKMVPALDNVLFTKDGLTIGSNGLAVIAVGPVSNEMKKHVIVDETPLHTDIVVSTDTVKEAIKNIPRDTKFSGITEHLDINDQKISLHNGKTGGEKKLGVKLYNREYINYQGVFKNAFSNPNEIKTAINLRRLISVLSTIDKICPDSSQNTAIFMQFTKDKDLILRCENIKTKQRVIAIMKAYDGVESRFPVMLDWERKLAGVRKVITKVKRRVVGVTKSLRDVNLTLKKKGEEEQRRNKEGFQKLKKKIRGRKRV